LQEILSDCVGAKLNISKSALNVLQATTIVNPRAALQLVYDQFPLLAELPLITDGFNCVGTPVGHSSFNGLSTGLWLTVLSLSALNFNAYLPTPTRMISCF
jgi:hypothetical protein